MIDLHLCFYIGNHRYALNTHLNGVLNDSSGEDEAQSHSRQRKIYTYISQRHIQKGITEGSRRIDKIIPLDLLIESPPVFTIEGEDKSTGGGVER